MFDLSCSMLLSQKFGYESGKELPNLPQNVRKRFTKVCDSMVIFHFDLSLELKGKVSVMILGSSITCSMVSGPFGSYNWG